MEGTRPRHSYSSSFLYSSVCALRFFPLGAVSFFLIAATSSTSLLIASSPSESITRIAVARLVRRGSMLIVCGRYTTSCDEDRNVETGEPVTVRARGIARNVFFESQSKSDKWTAGKKGRKEGIPLSPGPREMGTRLERCEEYI